jgi:phosphopantetheine adenylyltransferase
LMNQKLAPAIPTVLLVARANHVYLSSSFVRDTAQLEGLIVPGSVSPVVEEALRARFPRRKPAHPVVPPGGGAPLGVSPR